jgi:serine/threonine protein kinase
VNCYRCKTPLPDNARYCFTCGADVSGEHEHTLAVEEDPQLRQKLQEEIGGDFVIDRELGRGGMAVVYLGHDAHLGRKVAIKVLPPELTFGHSSMVERFKREARTAATLDHPNIIPVYRVSTSGKLFWYVMKYLEGEALDEILKREGQLAVERAAEIVRQVADALGFAHRHNVVHRDVKPANVMIDTEGRITVTDFGIAKALDAHTLTASGSMIGTPYYMSPEQCSGKRVGPASDQYSLAVMAFQMLGGHVPFEGESVVDIIRKHVMDPVPPLDVLRPGLPRPLIEVVERGLSKPPDDRFPSVADFARAFANAAQGLDVTAVPVERRTSRTSSTEIISPVPVEPEAPPAPPARGSPAAPAGPRAAPARPVRPPLKRRPRRTAWMAGGAVVAIVGAAVAGVFLMRGRTAELGVAIGQRPGDSAVVAQRGDTAAPQAAGAPAPADTLPVTRGDTGSSVGTTPAPQLARLALRGLPRDAVVTVDGRQIRGASTNLEPGRSHQVVVTAQGFLPWRRSVTPREGERLSILVQMTPVETAARPAPPTGAPTQPSPGAVQPPSSQPPAASAVSLITVGSIPLASIAINGRSVVGNPVRDYEVPAGPVRLHFTWTDSTGTHELDTTIVVAPGSQRLGRIRLRS